MKIISIVSSCRKKGNTERIVRRIEEEFLQIAIKQNVQVEFEQIHLGNSDIQFCRGCRICFKKVEDQCPLKDGLLNIRDKLSKTDGVILASPVYVEDINGIMKNWIDRMAFNCHRPAFAGKTTLIVTTSGGVSTNHALRTMNSALHTWGFHICSQNKFRTGGFMEDEQINSLFDNQIKNIANKLFNTINKRKAEFPSFYSLIVFKVQQKYWQKTKNELNTFDYLYWHNKGWTQKGCNYYIPHNSNFVKVKIAGIVGSVVSMFFV